MKIAVLGAGAIGSSIGADLTEAGYDVLIIDQWPEHVDEMKKEGLKISFENEKINIKVKAAHICELPMFNEKYDIVLLTSKSYDSCWLAELIKPYINRGGMFVSIQNSLNNEWLIPVIGYEKNIGAVVELSAELYDPGKIKRNTDRNRTWFAIGELHGRKTSRLEVLSDILLKSGKVEITTNIWGAKWSKLIANSMMQGLSALLGLPDYEATSIPDVLNFCIEIGREAAAVGTALGFEMEAIYGLRAEDFTGSTDEMLKVNLETLKSHIGKKSYNSVYQDHFKGRYSEIDYLNGLIVKKGKSAGISTPYNEEIVRLTDLVRNKKIKPSKENIALIENFLRG